MSSQRKNTTSTQRNSTMLNLIVSRSWKNAQLLLCSLSLFYLANSAPLEESSRTRPLSQDWEEARQIWNGIRSVKKQLADRELSRMRRTSEDNSGLDNVSAPAYMKELYRNISHLDAEDLDVTTIRSLPAINTAGGCGFNFTIGDASQNEIFRRAELRIHMKQPRGDQVKPVYLQLYHGTHRGRSKVFSPNREEWIVFDVLSDIQHWREANHPHKKIHFYVIMYTTLDDFIRQQNGLDCHEAPIEFDQPTSSGQNCTIGESTADHQPLLMIYTYELDAVQFNLSAIVEAAKDTQSDDHRYKRDDDEYTNVEQEPTTAPSSSPTPGCRKHALQIDLDTFNNIWHSARPDQNAIFPPQLSINTCGGSCNRDIPDLSAQHSILLYYLYTKGRNVPVVGSQWDQCCVPVVYEHRNVIFSLPGGEIRTVSLKGISVGYCSCLTILKWPENKR